MSEPRVVKRYSNRKLYDTQKSRYVTLDQIAELIRTGQDVKIIDNTSKEDLTSVTLAQIIFEQEKKQNSFLSLPAMKNIIQSGGESISEFASHAGATVKEKVRSVFRRDSEGGEIVEGEVVESQPEAAADSDAAAPHSVLHELRELIGRSQPTIEEWQKRVDDRINKVVETLAPWTALEKELSELRTRTAELEKRLAETEADHR